MGIIIYNFKVKKGNKRIDYTKDGVEFSESCSLETKDDARPELGNALKVVSELVKDIYMGMLDKDCVVVPESIRFNYDRSAGHYLLKKVRIKGSVFKAEETTSLSFDTEDIQITLNKKTFEDALVNLVREIGLFVMGTRAQTTFDFKELRLEISKVQVNNRTEIFGETEEEAE